MRENNNLTTYCLYKTYFCLMCSIQSIPKLRLCNLGCRLFLNQHHQHGSRHPRMFQPYSMNTLVVGGPTVVINHWVLIDCFQLISSRLSHSKLDARSAAWLSLWIALFLSLPLVPTAVISLHTYKGTKASHAYFYWEQPNTPAFLFTKIQ